MQHTLRPIQPQDVAGAIQLVRDTLTEFGLQFGVGAETDAQLHGLPDSYVDRGGAFFVAVGTAGPNVGRVIGTAGVFPVGPAMFELRKMYLHPAARGQGIGARLFDACRTFCVAQGARHLVLDTRDNMTDAIAFYLRRGFVRDDTQIRGARCSQGYRLDL